MQKRANFHSKQSSFKQHRYSDENRPCNHFPPSLAPPVPSRTKLDTRSILTDLSNIPAKFADHATTLACLSKCTEWYVDVFDSTNPDHPTLMTRLRQPQIMYKHCSDEDQNDALDDLVQHRAPLTLAPKEMAIVFPLTNKTKGQNIQITNFEKENKIKQETFALTFQTSNDPAIRHLVFLDKDSAKRQFTFNINGTVHGQSVFSEVIFYMMKGGKLVNCLLSQINQKLLSQVDSFAHSGQQGQQFPEHFVTKIKDLPKSFGCHVSLQVEKQSRNFQQLNRRLFHLVNDSSGQLRAICEQQPYPFTVSNLQDFTAHVRSFTFVFNINDTLLNENSFYNQPNTPHDDLINPVPVTLSPHLLTILTALKHKQTFNTFANEPFLSNFERLIAAVSIPQTTPHQCIQSLMHSIFLEVSCFGLKVLYCQKGKPQQAVYMPSLSLINVHKGDLKIKFHQPQPPHLRALLVSELTDSLKSPDVKGYFAVLLTQQRGFQDETSFLAYYQIEGLAVSLIGVYPSRDLFQNQLFWFKHQVSTDPILYAQHEMKTKTEALKSFVTVQQLVQEDSTDEELHRDFYFMQKQHRLLQMQPEGRQWEPVRQNELFGML